MGEKIKNLKQLKKKLIHIITKAIVENVIEDIKDLHIEKIEKHVYKVYKPKKYSRRKDNGGLTDKKNMKTEIIKNANSVELKFSNVTKSNPKNLPEGYTSEKIAGNIEYGKRYHYMKMKPRPFIAKTRKSLKKGEFKKMLKKALIIRGFILK